LVNTALFNDHYAAQTQYTLTGDLQAFSFLHRSFVFKRIEKKEEEVKEEVQEVQVPVLPTEEAPKEPKEKKAKRVLKAKVPIENPPVFFFSGNSALNENQYLSALYEAPIQVEGMTFPTVEHYFQWSKAKQFGDAEAQAKILKTPSAKSVKAYGKKVKNFNEEAWTEVSQGVMRTGLKAKFMQHPELLKKLRETGTRPLAEADPRGKFWGIGTSADTSKANDPAKWPGKNIMGKLLEEIRTELKE
jgi:ribA/ribD-fused uncharacterized protein